MSKTKRVLAFVGLGLLAGAALVVSTVVSPPSVQAPLIAFLLVPAEILHAVRLDFLMGPAFSPDVADEVGFGALFLFTAIVWPVIGVVSGALIALFTGRSDKPANSHA